MFVAFVCPLLPPVLTPPAAGSPQTLRCLVFAFDCLQLSRVQGSTLGLKEPTARKSLSKEHETLTSQLNSEHDAELCHETSTISVRLLHLSGNSSVLYFSLVLPRWSHMGPPRPSGGFEFKGLGRLT